MARKREIKIPGPEHPMSMGPHTRPVSVTAEGIRIAESTNALILREASYQPVYYIPISDIDMRLLERLDQRLLLQGRLQLLLGGHADDDDRRRGMDLPPPLPFRGGNSRTHRLLRRPSNDLELNQTRCSRWVRDCAWAGFPHERSALMRPG